MSEPRRYKLVWFAPREALEGTRSAVFAVGAGRIGRYERCSWYTAGTGTFLAGKGADPSIGQVGKEERVSELRVETVVPAELVLRFEERDGIAKLARLTANGLEVELFHILTFT